MSPDEEVIRGHKAAQVLDNELVKEAFEEVRKHILKVWESTPARDVEGREWTFKLFQASLKFEEIFKGYIDTGKVAADKIKQQSLLGKFKSMI